MVSDMRFSSLTSFAAPFRHSSQTSQNLPLATCVWCTFDGPLFFDGRGGGGEGGPLFFGGERGEGGGAVERDFSVACARVLF